uniref:Uncharacterized protein n=1 Tax=Cacopsylla melanoneura TaxID=428564 RepID=A0A8D8QH24_9HEMI
MESGEGGSSTLRRRLDDKTADYFEHLVHHRVFIQNGDTFLGKQLILLFKHKTCAALSRLDVQPLSSPEELPSVDSLATSFEDREIEQENEEDGGWPPDGVFEGFVRPDKVKPDDDDQFWDYQMLGEFQMDQISPEDYGHVLSLSSSKARKKLLYSLFRKLKRDQAAKAEAEANQGVESLGGNRQNEAEAEEEEEEMEYEIYTSVKHPEQMERKDPRLAYLDTTTIIQLCDTEQILTCGTLILDAFTSNLPSDIALLNTLIESIVPHYWYDPAVIPATQNIILVTTRCLPFISRMLSKLSSTLWTVRVK